MRFHMFKRISLAILILGINQTFAKQEPLQPFLHQKQAIQLLPNDQKLLTEIEQSLNAITSMKAEFSQISIAANGQKTETKGLFLISRQKGESVKFRFEYAPPQKIMLVGVGNNVNYYDNEVNQTTPIDLRSTPAAFLAHKEIRFNEDYIITNFLKSESEIRISVIQKKDPASGSIFLIFERQGMKLKGWRLTDAHGTDTLITLLSKEEDIKLDPNIFKFFSPKTGGKPEPLYTPK